jgi:hypothetical protein
LEDTVKKWVSVKKAGQTLANPNSKVRSLNPTHNEPVDGTYGPYKWEERPAGTSGGYERCSVVGSIVWYNPTGREAVPFTFVENDPHYSGMSLLLESEQLKIDTVPL